MPTSRDKASKTKPGQNATPSQSEQAHSEPNTSKLCPTERWKRLISVVRPASVQDAVRRLI